MRAERKVDYPPLLNSLPTEEVICSHLSLLLEVFNRINRCFILTVWDSENMWHTVGNRKVCLSFNWKESQRDSLAVWDFSLTQTVFFITISRAHSFPLRKKVEVIEEAEGGLTISQVSLSPIGRARIPYTFGWSTERSIEMPNLRKPLSKQLFSMDNSNGPFELKSVWEGLLVPKGSFMQY